MVLASNALFPSELRACLALRTLDRAWQHYREDRGIALGERLVGAECATERDAFLKLVLIALPFRTSSLGEAVTLVRKIAIRPFAVEVKQSEVVVVEVGTAFHWQESGYWKHVCQTALCNAFPHLWTGCGIRMAERGTL